MAMTCKWYRGKRLEGLWLRRYTNKAQRRRIRWVHRFHRTFKLIA